MPNVLVRDVETSILEKLKARAALRSRSLQSEMQIILKDAATKMTSKISNEYFRYLIVSFLPAPHNKIRLR